MRRDRRPIQANGEHQRRDAAGTIEDSGPSFSRPYAPDAAPDAAQQLLRRLRFLPALQSRPHEANRRYFSLAAERRSAERIASGRVLSGGITSGSARRSGPVMARCSVATPRQRPTCSTRAPRPEPSGPVPRREPRSPGHRPSRPPAKPHSLQRQVRGKVAIARSEAHVRGSDPGVGALCEDTRGRTLRPRGHDPY